jgi:hypothetical protein
MAKGAMPWFGRDLSQIMMNTPSIMLLLVPPAKRKRAIHVWAVFNRSKSWAIPSLMLDNKAWAEWASAQAIDKDGKLWFGH